MSDPAKLLVDHLDIWTGAIERKTGAGRGNGGKINLYGIDKLRSLILDLAVRGKLVPQDPADRDANELLRQIQASDKQVARKRKAKDPSSSFGIKWDVPESWRWVHLDEIAVYIQRGKGPKYDDEGSAKVVSQKCIQWAGFDLSVARTISDKSLPGYAEERFIRLGDILWNSTGTGTVGRANVYTLNNGEKVVADSHVTIVRPILVEPRYITAFIASSEVQARMDPSHTAPLVSGTTNQVELNTSSVKALPFPLPPLAEQKRIVAKVDELMALVDALEAGTRAGIAAHETLVRELLATLVNSQDADDLARTWARIESLFDTLFTTEDSIDALKQTLLELAVRGKLVPQDESDEPAEKMLARAKAVVTKGTKVKSHPPIKPEEQPFPIPRNWHWERFDNLIRPDAPIAYGVLVPGDDQSDGVPFVRIADLSITDPPVRPEKAISRVVDAQYERTRIMGGEILMGVVGSIGKLGVAPDSWAGANIARAICRIVPASFMDRDYVLWLLQSRFMQDSFKGDTRTLAQPTLNLTLIRLAATPIPPLAEQHRIVAKVSELIAICDVLRARITDVGETSRHFADALTTESVA